jgi:hypothetical protein
VANEGRGFSAIGALSIGVVWGIGYLANWLFSNDETREIVTVIGLAFVVMPFFMWGCGNVAAYIAGKAADKLHP